MLVWVGVSTSHPVLDHLLDFVPARLLSAGRILVDLLAYCLESAVLNSELIFLKFVLYVLDQVFVLLVVHFLLKLLLIIVVNDGDEQLIDEVEVVVAH